MDKEFMHNKNMRYIINNELFAQMVAVAGKVVQKDTKTVLHLGERELGENVLCAFRVTTPAEEIVYQMAVKKPEGWNANGNRISVNASKFLQMADSLLSFNEDVYLEPEGAVLKMGVGTKAKTSINIESQIPDAMKAIKPMYCFKADGAKFVAALKKGCSFSKDTVDAQHQLHLGIMRLDVANNKVVGYSSDGNISARSECSVEFLTNERASEKAKPYVEQMNGNITEYCEAKGLKVEDFVLDLRMPHDSVNHLISIVEGQSAVSVTVDANQVQVQIGNNLRYTLVQGAMCGIPIAALEKFAADAPEAAFGIDAANLSRAVEFINKNNSIAEPSAKLPIKMELSADKLILTSGKSNQIESEAKPTAVNGTGTASISGQYLKNALSALNRGGVAVNYGKGWIVLFNGTVEEPDRTTYIMIMQVAVAQVEEETESEATEE